MRIMWRGLELPGRVVRDESVSNDSYGRFVVEPFEQGFGTTIGNSLRRVLLSSLEGAAVTSVKIAGAPTRVSLRNVGVNRGGGDRISSPVTAYILWR